MSKPDKDNSTQERRIGRPAEGQETWAASRAQVKGDEKEILARYYAVHDFLLAEGSNPEGELRETAASIFVNQGTGPNVVARESLKWISAHPNKGPFHITWYSPGTLLFATLHEFRMRMPSLSAATHVHLFPGTVDLQLQAQIDQEAQGYARSIKRRFSYMILSGHSFDLATGNIGFHFDREISIQRTCALLEATQKFLFFDSSKFTGEGEVGYSLRDLLGTCNGIVFYTIASSRSREIKDAFGALCGRLLIEKAANTKVEKSVRLVMVGSNDHATESSAWHGILRTAHDRTSKTTARTLKSA